MDYGQNRILLPYVDPREDKADRTTVFQLDAITSVLIKAKPCNDLNNGELFDTTVTVTLGEEVFDSCGRALF